MSNVQPKKANKLAQIVVWEEFKPVLGKVLDLLVDWALFDLLSLVTVTVVVLVFVVTFVGLVGLLVFGFSVLGVGVGSAFLLNSLLTILIS